MLRHFSYTDSPDSPRTVSCSTNELCIQRLIHGILPVFETHGELSTANTRDLRPLLHTIMAGELNLVEEKLQQPEVILSLYKKHRSDLVSCQIGAVGTKLLLPC